MATPKFNSKSPTIKRILREASELSTTPSPDYHASPASDSDLFEWHFTLRGPPSSSFSAGIYHGRIVLPPTYPLRPPSFRFLTPSGRFEPNREICLSISGHHEESWQPAWGIRTALVALRAFMETDAKGQVGGLDTTEAERRRCAEASGAWKCRTCGRANKEILEECVRQVQEQGGDGGEGKVEEVPEGLVIGSKEDLEKKNKETQPEAEATRVPQSSLSEQETEAELAEGFVQTAPVPESSYPAARPAQSVPQPTASQSIPVNQINPPQAQMATVHTRRVEQRHSGVSSDGVPMWIDRTIAGIIICLVFMVLKMLLGF